MGGIILLLLVIAAFYDQPTSVEVRAIYLTGFILACIVYYRADTLMDRLKEIESLVTPDDERSDEDAMHRSYMRAHKRGFIPKA